MNVHDAETQEFIGENRLLDIFDRQFILTVKYKEIERQNGFYVPEELPVVIDDRHAQLFIKGHVWRVTEELCEAWEAYQDALTTGDYVHYLEEMSDALHFYVELLIFVGIGCDELGSLEEIIKGSGLLKGKPDGSLPFFVVMEPVYFMGLAMNCLKNKPWKQSQMLTDQGKMRGYLKKGFKSLIEAFYLSGMGADDIWKIYVQKNSVNQFRIRSSY